MYMPAPCLTHYCAESCLTQTRNRGNEKKRKPTHLTYSKSHQQGSFPQAFYVLSLILRTLQATSDLNTPNRILALNGREQRPQGIQRIHSESQSWQEAEQESTPAQPVVPLGPLLQWLTKQMLLAGSVEVNLQSSACKQASSGTTIDNSFELLEV